MFIAYFDVMFGFLCDKSVNRRAERGRGVRKRDGSGRERESLIQHKTKMSLFESLDNITLFSIRNQPFSHFALHFLPSSYHTALRFVK